MVSRLQFYLHFDWKLSFEYLIFKNSPYGQFSLYFNRFGVVCLASQAHRGDRDATRAHCCDVPLTTTAVAGSFQMIGRCCCCLEAPALGSDSNRLRSSWFHLCSPFVLSVSLRFLWLRVLPKVVHLTGDIKTKDSLFVTDSKHLLSLSIGLILQQHDESFTLWILIYCMV